MKIAICDDEPIFLSQISGYINQYIQNRKAEISYDIFSNAIDLLSVSDLTSYDVFLLDILMPHTNGIDASKKIRLFNPSAIIIFLTSSPEFALESYSVKAYDYIVKPLSSEKIFTFLDDIISKEMDTTKNIIIKSRHNCLRIPLSELSYVEILNKKLYFHMLDGQIQIISAPMSKIESQILQNPYFIKVHRCFIVNMRSISILMSYRICTDSKDIIPVSRRLYPQVRRAYMNILFSETGVTKLL